MTPGRAFAPLQRRSGSGTTALLREIVANVDRPVREAYIPDAERLVYGNYDPLTDQIVLSLELMRVTCYVHEQIHRLHESWSEATVRRRTTQVVCAMSDDQIQALNRRIVAALRAQRRTQRTPRRAR